MPLAGFEPKMPASERSHTYALHRAATQFGRILTDRTVNVNLLNGPFIPIYVLLRNSGSTVLIGAGSHLGHRSHDTGKQNLEFENFCIDLG